jgi:hypothetical protein
MKYLLSLGLFLGTSLYSLSQEIPLQLLIGNNSAELSFFWNGGLGSSEKIQLFNFTIIGSAYDVPKSNFVEMYSVGTYFLSQSIGIAAGVRVANTEFLPVTGISFQKAKGDFFLNILSLVQFQGFGKPPVSSAFMFLTDKFPVKDKLSVFYQLSLEPSFQGTRHKLSYQSLLIGLDTNKKFQYGLGATIIQNGERFEISSNIGVFIRLELEGK